MSSRRAAAWLAAALATSGCVATQRDVLDLSQQTDDIKASVAELKRSIASMQANQADLAVKMDQVRTDLSVFTENLKDSQDRMTRLGSKLDDVEVALGQKVSALGESLNKQQQQQLAAQKASQQAAEQAARDAATAAETAAKKAAEEAVKAATPPAGTPTPSQVFHDAQKNLSRKAYDLAAQGFETYLKLYPKGEMADLAMFYLGESRYGSKSWEDAARQYAQLLDRFPKSDITAAARLKYAMTLLNLKTAAYSAEAKRYLQSIQDDFPKSPEATAAAKLLAKLDGKSKSAPSQGQNE
ncbi:MAG: outer membrane protein assembly factor BamD [Elusimicrobia bacterium]|nr:outer membrane protein assembly factor BamD [Elusimicrobiota bacterium]